VESEHRLTFTDEQQLSCSVWDSNEVFRVQLFEKYEVQGKVRILLQLHVYGE
jgi:hypothetical protein